MQFTSTQPPTSTCTLHHTNIVQRTTWNDQLPAVLDLKIVGQYGIFFLKAGKFLKINSNPY